MRPLGFSTGALAFADFRRGLHMMSLDSIQAAELSALRENELEPLLSALESLDLSNFSYVSIHAPSQFTNISEQAIHDQISHQLWRQWPIVVHPDAITDFGMWRDFGSLLCIENMDKRKPIGRSRQELAYIFDELPEASLCFDIGHARQFDPTMTEAYLILRDFGFRLAQVHVSEVNSSSKHDRLSYSSILAFQEVSGMIPSNVPLILETPVLSFEIEAELKKIERVFPLKQEVMVA